MILLNIKMENSKNPRAISSSSRLCTSTMAFIFKESTIPRYSFILSLSRIAAIKRTISAP